MSFEPVARWALRCDGDTTYGQCLDMYEYYPDGDEENGLVLGLWDKPKLSDRDRSWLLRGRDDWALMPDGRVFCPCHIAAAEYLVRAGLEGLPFEEAA